MNKQKGWTVTSVDLTLFAIFLAVFKPYLAPDNIQIALKIILIVCVIAFLLLHYKRKIIFNISILLTLPIICSCIYNYFMGSTRQEFLNGILYAICLYALCTLILYWISKGYSAAVIRDIYYMVWAYSIISIISILILGRAETYFFGSKFFTSYYFMLLIGLYYFNNKSRIESSALSSLGYFLLIGVLFFFTARMGCATGMIGILSAVIFSLIPEQIKKTLANPFWIIIAVIVSLLLMFLISSIAQLDFVQYIIVNIFHRSANLTDRLRYYLRAVDVFQSNNIWLGYGYNTSNMRNMIGLGSNIQNGFMQHILNYGIFGGITCLYFIYKSVQRTSGELYRSWGLYIIVYTLIICAVVEVSFNTIFFMTLFLLYGLNHESVILSGKNKEPSKGKNSISVNKKARESYE